MGGKVLEYPTKTIYNAGKKDGREEGREEEKIFNIRNLMETLSLTAQQAMDALKVDKKEQKKYLKQL